MKKFIFLLLIPFVLLSEPNDYKTRGVKSYLVNYGAIQNNSFLVKFALNRFAFLDEASQKELKIIRNLNKDYLVLVYKDLVATYTFYSEFENLNKIEKAFIHSAEPSGLNTVIEDGKWRIKFLRDRRFDYLAQKPEIYYKLYWAFDTNMTFSSYDSIFASTDFVVSLPKSARWIKVNSIVDGEEIEYSYPFKLFYNEAEPLVSLTDVYVFRGQVTDTIVIAFESIGKISCDSGFLIVDFSLPNNRFETHERIRLSKLDSDTLFIFSSKVGKYNGGYDFYFEFYSNGSKYRFPNEGFWHTNPNNRLVNPEYGFFVMNVGHPEWFKAYVDVVKSKLPLGYNGIFVDDTWERIGSWASDASPSNLDYSDSTWLGNVTEFLKKLKSEFIDIPVIFNGLSNEKAFNFLPFVDGAMTEGYPTNTWRGVYDYSVWLALANIALKCQNVYEKQWLCLPGMFFPDPKYRLFALATFLLLDNGKAYYACAQKYQLFEHYPEFDIPTGKPLVTAHDRIEELRYFDVNSKPYFKRTFENVVVYVNPSNTDTLIIPELQNKKMIVVDTFSTIEGGAIETVDSDDKLLPNEGRIIINSQNLRTILVSPSFGKCQATAEGIPDGKIKFSISAEAMDCSSDMFFSRTDLPLYVAADLTNILTFDDFVLQNDGVPVGCFLSEYKAELIAEAGINLKNVEVPIIAYSPTGILRVTKVKIETKNIDTANYIPNFSFEYDIDMDGLPDKWMPYYSGYLWDTINSQHGKKSIFVRNDSINQFSGARCDVEINQTTAEKLILSGWSKAIDVSGDQNNDYSIYGDFYYFDNTPLYGRTAKFSTRTHDWEYSECIIEPAKPIKQASIYALFRRHTGSVWFDNLALKKYEPINIVDYEEEVSCLKYNKATKVLEFSVDANKEGIAFIRVVDISGRTVYAFARELQYGSNEFTSGSLNLHSGTYLVIVEGVSSCRGKINVTN